MATSLPNLLDTLPRDELERISHEYSEWYNEMLSKYYDDFGIDNDSTRAFEDVSEVVRFFKTAIEWWGDRIPVQINAALFTPLEAVKAWTCNGQIRSLRSRFLETGIPEKYLDDPEKINEHDDDLES